MQCKTLLDADSLWQTMERLSEAVRERHANCEAVALLGIQRRGADLAERLKAMLDEHCGVDVPLGKLDINLYRDDWTSITNQPSISCTEIRFDITRYTVILVDDVLYTGRTIRAALEALTDFGRPRSVELLVLVDRGWRELPIQPDYAGVLVQTERTDHVDVYVTERDERDEVCIRSGEAR